ncbi:DEAD/DEAH box helicase family protein [Gluconobacter sp. R75690]|uniref:DEAD/DEAH box helicase family protein n=1 Tax=Gluconobacter TaxID=441 RepID=UPI00188C3E74|nr:MULTISPECIES: DEAD/DEAH box helicase family protein [unclassified Gluconobacter]MBF0851044.1 DEAD/DEAH box helicase family protein [Gluconobacter sp. R75690]MBF0879736.1 DEAD/DEAH box helicase family protein [Gluconobacter sp. R75828]
MALTKADLTDYAKLRGIWRKDPVLYAQQRLGLNPTAQQRQLLEAIAPAGAKVSVRAGHGVGKSGATSATILWHLECYEYCRIPCTAPTASQLYNVLWAELSKWMRRSDEQSKTMGLPSELLLSNLFDKTQDRLADKGNPSEWYAVARTSRREAPDALQGFHASDVQITDDNKAVERSSSGGSILFVIEEASGVPDEIFEVAEGALSSHGARLLMVGNPTKNSGFFARSQKQDRALYTALHFSCSDSPLVDDTYRKNLVRKYGEGSNVVRVRADGDFPNQDDDVLIPLELTEAALERKDGERNGPRRLGVDVARFGDDRTTFVLRAGDVIEQIEVRSKQDTMTTAGMAAQFFRQWSADEIHVDVVGIGAGVADRLREQNFPVTDVNVAEKAPENLDLKDAVPAKLRDYLWLEMAEWMKGTPAFMAPQKENAEDLAGELSTVRYGLDSSGRMVVESKDAMKKRGVRSPDLADALGVTFAPEKRKPMIFTITDLSMI